jgi:hypothetical protein
VFGSPAREALEVWLGIAEILEGCDCLGGMASNAEILQGLGAWPSERKFLQGYEGLEDVARQRSCRVEGLGGVWLVGDRKFLWISGFKGSFHGDPAVLRGGSLG